MEHYPEGYDVLCVPCNTSKAGGDACALDHTEADTSKENQQFQLVAEIQTDGEVQGKRGGNGGRTDGEKRVKLTLSVLERTDAYLRKQGVPMSRVVDDFVAQAEVSAPSPAVDVLVELKAELAEMKALILMLQPTTQPSATPKSPDEPLRFDYLNVEQQVNGQPIPTRLTLRGTRGSR